MNDNTKPEASGDAEAMLQALDAAKPHGLCDAAAAEIRRLRAEVQRLSAPPMRHVGECADDPIARDVCEGIYADRVDDNIALCEALRAVYALAGQNKEIAKIVHDAIREHGVVGENT